MNAPESTLDIEDALRSLAERAGPSVVARDDLDMVVLRRLRGSTRRRKVLVGVLTGVVAVGSAAAVQLGRSPYFTVTQPSAAMAPTITVGGTVTLDRELIPHTGDVVYVSVSAGGEDYRAIYRVVGEPGDVVACPETERNRCEAVLVNGRRLGDPYLDALTTTAFAPATVPTGSVFVLGDNRMAANDSRYVGSIPLDDVEGVAVAAAGPDGVPQAIPGAPPHEGPGDQDVVDPPGPVPPAGATAAP